MRTGKLLHRQINPSFVQQGRVTSQAFRPTPKDRSCLSVYDGDLIVPEACWQHYTEELGHGSVGVLSVTVGECQEQELPVRSDPIPFPEHALIDFSGLPTNRVKAKAKLLLARAVARGWQYLAGELP